MTDPATELGVTGNAILLLGYLAGCIGAPHPKEEPIYEVIEIDAANGNQRVRHRVSGNVYRVTVEQIEGQR